MDDNIVSLVKAQHEHFGIAYQGPPRKLTVEEKRFRYVCMAKEIMEFLLADDLVDEYDALLDLLVFAAGTLQRQGLPLRGIHAVVDANLQKELGPALTRGGFELDLVKPEGWAGPESKLENIIQQHASLYNDDNSRRTRRDRQDHSGKRNS